MKALIYSCPTIKRELLTALSAANNHTPVVFLPEELHSNPQHLQYWLQTKIDNLTEIERVIICVSGCGGALVGLKATTAELVIPRTRDCVDLLLAGDDYRTVKRHPRVYMTESWFEHLDHSALNLEKLRATKGRAAGDAFLRKLYQGFEDFYLIDSGAYDLDKVRASLKPYLEVLGGSLNVVKGECGLIRKIARAEFDANFLRIARGDSVPPNFYLPNPRA